MKAAVIALFVLLQVFLLFVARHDTMDVDSYPNTVPTPNLLGGDLIGQTFKAPSNGLARIDVLLGTHGRLNDKDVRFRLWELEPVRVLAVEIGFNASDVRNNLYRTFRFPPRPKSKGRAYLFELDSPASTPSNSIAVWMNASDVYPHGEFVFNGRAAGGDLTFRAYARRTVWEELPRIARHGSGVFRSVFVLAAAIFLFEAAAIALLKKLLDALGKE
jgi:hypothetical protein